MPSEASVDIFTDRRSHPRRILQPAGCCRLPTSVRSGLEPCHRRLAAGHECHAPVYHEIRAEPPGAFHRAGADAYTGPYREPPVGDSELCAQAILGAQYRLPRYYFLGPHPQERRRAGTGSREAEGSSGRRQEAQEGGREPRYRSHNRPCERRGAAGTHQGCAVYRYLCDEEGRPGSAAPPFRPDLPAGGVQQEVCLLGRRHAEDYPVALREEGHYLSSCRYYLLE